MLFRSASMQTETRMLADLARPKHALECMCPQVAVFWMFFPMQTFFPYIVYRHTDRIAAEGWPKK